MLRDAAAEGTWPPERPPRTPGMWSPQDEPYRSERAARMSIPCCGRCSDTEYAKGEACDHCDFLPDEEE
jgi:hypothetical protein